MLQSSVHQSCSSPGSPPTLRAGTQVALLIGMLALVGVSCSVGYFLGRELISRDLAVRLAQMEGEVQRLNVLGSRLVEMAHLDPEDFTFDQPTPRGGPEEYDFNRTETGDLVREINAISKLIEDRGRRLDVIESLLMKEDFGERQIIAGSPVPTGWLSSTFGVRRDPWTGRRTLHRGIDLVAKMGTEVVSVADGVVEHSGWRDGYGRTIEIRHAGGYMTRYAHNKELLVEEGAEVKQGQGIAKVGSSGRTTGVHLHFEVLRNGQQIDPLKYVQVSERGDEG